MNFDVNVEDITKMVSDMVGKEKELYQNLSPKERINLALIGVSMFASMSDSDPRKFIVALGISKIIEIEQEMHLDKKDAHNE